MIPLAAIPWRLVGIAAVVLAIGGLLWHDHHQTQKANRLVRETSQLKADYAALQAAQAHERKIANEASNEFQRTVKQLQSARADTPVRSVRLCRSPTGYVPAPAPAASGIDARTAAGFSREVRQDSQDGWGGDRWSDSGPDIGPQLYAEADRANEFAAQCNALIKWAKSR